MVNIRPAAEGDIPRIIDLYDKLSISTTRIELEKNPTRAEYLAVFEEILAGPGHELLVAEENGEVVGSVVLIIVPNLSHRATPWALAEYLIVDPELRRRGIGRKLMEYVIVRARKAGCYRIEVMSDKKRREAHKLYHSVGFEELAYGFRLYF